MCVQSSSQMVQILAFESNPYQNPAAVLQTEAAGRRLAGGGVSAASLGCLGELLVMGLVEI